MTKNNTTKNYHWICIDCGKKYGREKDPWLRGATWHYERCDICHNNTLVTEPRDFGGLDLERVKKK
jgi:hypothetical protein